MHAHLKLGVSTIALAAISTIGIPSAYAQPAPAAGGESVEAVTVTGTSIAGITAPVGSNLITVGQQEIQNIGGLTISDVTADVPAISNFGNDGRGENENGGPGESVYIHQIGASAQNATLVIVDGHRVPIAGTGNSVVDANLIPQVMLQRVEVLADGSSAIYGSDAVAGVVNFITRDTFDGLQVHYQSQFEHGAAMGEIGDVLAGSNWNGGGFVAAYSYTFEGDIADTSEWWTNPLIQTPRAIAAGDVGTTGGTTYFGNFNCDPATIQPNGTGNIYLNAKSSTGVANAAANAPCSQWAYEDYLPSETRQNAMVKLHQNISDNLILTATGNFYTRRSVDATTRGTLTATAFGTGPQANPFYINPPGVTATAQTIRYDFDQLLGPGATADAGDDEVFGTADLAWNINSNWKIDLLANAGTSSIFTGEDHGVVNTGMAELDLNGTNQSTGKIPAGTPTSTAVVGTSTVVTQLPLTAANALDVWDPASSNQTSAATLNALTIGTANNNYNRYTNSYQQFRLTTNGTLFTTPAGAIKIAGGVEQFDEQYYEVTSTAENAGPTSVSSAFFQYDVGREITSEFLEADVPVVGPDMHIPFVEKLEFDLSGRHDYYSDEGATTNPKLAANWDVAGGLRLLANWSTSFVAPALLHDVVNGVSGNSGVSTGTPGSIPVALFPGVTQLGIPGCTASSVTCNTSTLQGLNINDSTVNERPMRGHGWTLGANFAPDFLPGFTSELSWWHVTFLGGVTAATPQIDAFNPLLNPRIILFPPSVTGNGTPCATQAQIAAAVGAAPVTSIIPTCVSVITNTSDDNIINFWASGLDVDAEYSFDTDYGHFNVGDAMSYELTFLQGFGLHGIVPTAQYRFEAKNSEGLNTTFPNIGTQSRGHIGWAEDAFSAELYVNFVGPYRNVSSTATTLIGSNSFNVYNGQGGDHVGAQWTFDTHFGYSFSGGIFGDDEALLTIRNLLNATPPFFNGSTGGLDGYDNYVSSPLGRVVEVGLMAKI